MSWAVGYDTNTRRYIGYGVPAYCDHPKCTEEIDRGLSYKCEIQDDNGDTETGCGRFFCLKHGGGNLCKRCSSSKPSYKKLPKEHPTWINHLLTDESWLDWRECNPDEVERYKAMLA